MLRRLLDTLLERRLDKNDWLRLGLQHRDAGRMHEAAECFERAVALAPDSTAALANAAAACRETGRIDESLELFRRARRLAPGNLDIFSAYLFTLNFSARASREEIFREHLEYGRLLESAPPAPGRARGPRERLRLGYLSPDLRDHAVAFFVEPLLAHHDRAGFAVACYFTGRAPDAVTARLRPLADAWNDCGGWSAEALAQRIAADGVDILVDLAGHTAGGRLDVLARKPAPVIATWLGYLNTTGLRCVDYRITDRHTDPPGATERFHTEKLARLPESQWCRGRPQAAAPVGALPALRGSVTFGSFNNATKLNAETLALWARVLLAVPGSTLVIAAHEGRRVEEARHAFTRHGIDPGRLEFFPRMALAQFRDLHQRVDIALDAHPYSGATTTLDSLWMGVPTLTYAGDAPMSRSTASILATLGLDDWVTRTPDEFVAAATSHSKGVARLSALRAYLRDRLEKSVLMDGARFTRQLEDLYRAMWRGES